MQNSDTRPAPPFRDFVPMKRRPKPRCRGHYKAGVSVRMRVGTIYILGP